MTPVLSVLLCLGLCLCNRTNTPAAYRFPKPSLRAENGPLVPQGGAVTLRCRGAWKAKNWWLLEKNKGSEWSLIKALRKAGNEGKFSLPLVTSNNAGTYRCLYFYIHGKSSYWLSKSSDPLELVVTGLYAPPSLAALPSSEVASGHNVTLQCGSDTWYDWCVLYKEGEEISRSLKRGRQANFFFPAVNLIHDGTYRCYRFHSSSPYLWSSPSAPLVLRVSGISKDPHLPQSSETPPPRTFSPSPESENRFTDAAALDYTVGNLVRLILAGLVLILLGVLLTEHWNSSRV